MNKDDQPTPEFYGEQFTQWQYLARRIQKGMRCSVKEATLAASEYMIKHGK